MTKHVDQWEKETTRKRKKKSRSKVMKGEFRRARKDSKDAKRRKKKILTEYNDFFEYFNLKQLKNYDSLLKYLEKKEVKVILNEKERDGILRKTNWKRNTNTALLANILCFVETHSFFEKFNIFEQMCDRFFDIVLAEENDDEDDEEEEDMERQIDLIRCVSNLCLNEKFGKKMKEVKLFQRILQYLPKCDLYRIQLEVSKIISNVDVDDKFLKRLKSKKTEVTELVDFTKNGKGKKMIMMYMTLFWSNIHILDDEFIRNHVYESEDQEFILSKVNTVCEIFDEYPLNVVEVEVPETLIFNDEQTREFTFPFNTKISGMVAFRSRGGGKCHRPIIYLYAPDQNRSSFDVSLKLRFQGNLTETIPDVEQWTKLRTTSNSQICVHNKKEDVEKNRIYPYLYWEGDMDPGLKTNIMSFVRPENKFWFPRTERTAQCTMRSFFCDYLAYRGFCDKEIADFVEYWVPVLEYSVKLTNRAGCDGNVWEVSFLVDQEVDRHVCGFDIFPLANVVKRVFMIVIGVKTEGVRPRSEFEEWRENGKKRWKRNEKDFVVREWGGMFL